MAKIQAKLVAPRTIFISTTEVVGEKSTGHVALSLPELSDEQVGLVFSRLDDALRTLQRHIQFYATQKSGI